jgi:tetratricopeptide (TPR) repeat protein
MAAPGPMSSDDDLPEERGNEDALARHREAVGHYRRTLLLDPANAALHNNLGGSILGAQGSFDDAIACFERAVALKPDYAEAHYNLANVLRAIGRFDLAASHYERVIAIVPKFAQAHYDLGNVLGDQGRLDEAAACYERAIAIQPGYDDAHTNLIVTRMDQGRLEDALSRCNRALAVNPNSADVHMCNAHILLLTGDFANGWREYEWRWRVKEAKPHGLIKPVWDGSPLDGRTILLHCEQGLGDSIQFIRYARLVKEQGARVLLSCPVALECLFANVAGVDEIFPAGHRLPEYDVHAPLLSLPGLFRTTLETIPAGIPCLHPDPSRVKVWRDRLAGRAGLRIGIAWRGKRKYDNDRNRSLTAVQFAAMLNMPELAVVNIQKDATPAELETLRRIPGTFFNAVPFEQGLHDTAALMANLDLVIAVDTSLCHLAGSVGVPVWTLIPFAPDWRWLLHRDDSPWYPTMRLYRQPSFGDWNSVLDRVRAGISLPSSRGSR